MQRARAHRAAAAIAVGTRERDRTGAHLGQGERAGDHARERDIAGATDGRSCRQGHRAAVGCRIAGGVCQRTKGIATCTAQGDVIGYAVAGKVQLGTAGHRDCAGTQCRRVHGTNRTVVDRRCTAVGVGTAQDQVRC